MTAYNRVRLGDVARITGGKRLPLGTDFVYTPTPHPYIRARDIHHGKVRIEDPVFLDEANARRLSRYIVRADDICLTIVGANVGALGVVPKILDGANLTENAVRIVSNGKADQRYLAYSLLTEDAFGQMKVLAGGSAQPKLGIYKIETLSIPLPPVPAQKRIATILRSYDDLIENNLQRIRILDEMARALYREWFVNLRFPPDLSRTGDQMPRGLTLVRLEDLASFIGRGISPSYDDNGASFVINQKCIRDQRLSLAPARRQRKTIPSKKLIAVGDVLINSTGVGTLGRVAQVEQAPQGVTVDSHVTIVRRQPGIDSDWFGLALLDREADFERMGAGATGQTELARSNVASIELNVPSPELQTRFGELVRPMRAQSFLLSSRSENLQRTRDLFLPHLLSGQINLEDVEPAA